MAEIKANKRSMRWVTIVLVTCLLHACQGKEKVTVNSEEKNHNNERPNMVQTHFNIREYNQRKAEGRTHYFLDDGTEVDQFDVDEGDELNYIETIRPPAPALLSLIRTYYGDGSLRKSGTEFPRQFQAGVWKEYNRQGEVISEVDYDKPFIFDFEALLDMIEERLVKEEKQLINVYDNTTMISRRADSKGVFWYVKYKQVEERRERIVIDGRSGEILERGFVEWEEN